MPSDSSEIVGSFLASGALPLSRSVSRVQAMLSRADYDAADLAQHLRLDPTLAAKVMSVANSAFFSRQPCSSIDDAVNRLGTVQLTRIFAQVLAGAALMTPLEAYGLTADALWRRSTLAAVGSELAARKLGEEGSSAYMVGLLHQIGMLVLDAKWRAGEKSAPFRRADFAREHSGDERKLCGLDQAALGAELLRQLSFPEEAHVVVGRQYREAVEPTAQFLYLGRLARSSISDGEIPDADPAVLRTFKLNTPSQLDAFLTDVRVEAQRRIQAG